MARYRNYAGYCRKYGTGTMQLISIGVPAIAFGAMACTPLVATHPFAAFSTGIYGGAFGYVAGAYAHIHANHFASRRNMPVAAGGRLARAWQTIAYGAIISAFAAAGLALDAQGDRHQQNTPPHDPAAQTVIHTPPAP